MIEKIEPGHLKPLKIAVHGETFDGFRHILTDEKLVSVNLACEKMGIPFREWKRSILAGEFDHLGKSFQSTLRDQAGTIRNHLLMTLRVFPMWIIRIDAYDIKDTATRESIESLSLEIADVLASRMPPVEEILRSLNN